MELVTGQRWRCDACGLVGPWSAGHRWYGALSDIDGGGGAPGRPRKPRAIVVACSDGCAVRLVLEGRVPAVGEDGSTATKPR